MNCVSLSELADAVEGTPIRLARAERTFRRVCTDSRQVQAGDLFWAIRGPHFDGHDFVDEAEERGAVACVVERDTGGKSSELILVRNSREALLTFAGAYRRTLETLVIGVTGSVGKTTTREMIYHTLSRNFNGIRSRLNFNNEIGVSLTLLEIDSDHEFAVVEMGARRRGDIETLCGSALPEIGVITDIAEAHLETFGSLDEIRLGKGELFDSLPEEGFGVLGGNPRNVSGLSERGACPIWRVGVDEQADIRATDVRFESGCLSFRIEGHDYSVPVPGKHFLNAALCAVAVAREVGMSHGDIVRGLSTFQAVNGRGNVSNPGGVYVIDDSYNASPASMTAACDLLDDFVPANRRILIVGDMLELGVEASRLHRELGRTIALHRIDRLIVMGHFAPDVIQGAVEAGLSSERIAHAACHDVAEVILDCWLEPNDAVLVKGSRGMRMEKIIDWLKVRNSGGLPEHPPDVRVSNPVRSVA